ncbi:hypothetical protein GF376_03450 [Candidatus Peregrinibacteria bacterium]|nr:hypothetical protein [Candidatus Peregrinibacteria bacterium]
MNNKLSQFDPLIKEILADNNATEIRNLAYEITDIVVQIKAKHIVAIDAENTLASLRQNEIRTKISQFSQLVLEKYPHQNNLLQIPPTVIYTEVIIPLISRQLKMSI